MPVSILVVEEVLDCLLPLKAVVHHVDGNKLNNDLRNLVVCEDQAYHKELHYREKALRDCGYPAWKYCVRCKSWSPQEEVVKYKGAHNYVHRECERKYQAHRMFVRRCGKDVIHVYRPHTRREPYRKDA